MVEQKAGSHATPLGHRVIDDDTAPVVLGLELARATNAEAVVRADNPGVTSPLGAGYDPDRGEADLVRFAPNESDDLIAEFIDRLRSQSPAAQLQARTALTISDFYTLLLFANRCAVRAIRDGDPVRAATGLAGIALVDDDRVDWRDAVRATAFGMHALARAGGDLSEGVRVVRTLPHPELASLLEGIESSGSAPSLDEWGYVEITTSYGVGIAERGPDRFNPTFDVAGLAVAIADLLDRDVYRTSAITLGSKTPAVWFPELERLGVEKIMKKAPATATINASVRVGESSDGESQQLTVFLAQTKDADAARDLADWGSNNSATSHAFVCASDDRLFALIIARSFVQGVPAMETTERLERFEAPLRAALSGARPPAA